MGMALATGWSPDVVRRLSGTDLGAIQDVFRERRRAQARAARKGRRHA
jgi:hypothetical protein